MQTKKSSNLAIALIWFTAAIFNGRNSHGYLVCTTRMETRFNRHRRWALLLAVRCFSVQVTSVRKPKKVLCKRYKFHLVKKALRFSLYLMPCNLMGWTAVMIYMGADVISILNQTPDASLFPFLTLGLGILIILWLLLGFTKLGIFKSISLVTMFLLMLWLSIQVANKPFIAMDVAQNIKFGTAVEICCRHATFLVTSSI